MKFYILILSPLSMCFVLLVGCSTPASESQSKDTEVNVSDKTERPGFGTLEDADIKIGVSLMDMGNPFMLAVKEGAEAFCNERGYSIQVVSAESNPEKQVSDIESLMTAGVNVLDARIVDTSAVKDQLAEVRAAGVAINTFPFMEESDTVVGYDDYDQGRMLAETAVEWINEKYNGKCEVAFLTQPTVDSVVQRSTAFRDYIEENCPEAEIVVEVEGYNPDTALADPFGINI